MNKDCTLGFMIGLGFGVGIALLFAPKSGDDTRALIANKTRKGTDYLKQQATELSDSAADFIEKSREEATRQKEGLKRAVETGKQAYQESAGHG